MKILPYIGFCFLLLCALCTGVNSYHRTKSIIAQDVNRALEQVLAKMPDNVVTTDTSVAATIGTMGTGGYAVIISSGYNAGDGGNGGTTSFGAYLSAAGGKGGAGVRNFSSSSYRKGAGATGQHNGGNGGHGDTIVGGGGGAGGWIVESITVFSGTDGSDASSDGTDGAGGTPNGLENAGDGAVLIWW